MLCNNDIPCKLVATSHPPCFTPQKVVKGIRELPLFSGYPDSNEASATQSFVPPCKVLRAGELKIDLGVKKYFPTGCCNQTCNIEQVQPTYYSDDFHDVRYPRWFFPNKNWLILVGRRSYRGSKVSFFLTFRWSWVYV